MMRRALLPDDLPRLAELEALLFPENSMNECSLEQEIRAGAAWVIGSPVCAYALVRMGEGLVDLTRLGVLPARQNQGHGSRLLKQVLTLEGEAMLTVEKKNTGALRLYHRFGFAIVATTPEAWVMRATSGGCETAPGKRRTGAGSNRPVE